MKSDFQPGRFDEGELSMLALNRLGAPAKGGSRIVAKRLKPICCLAVLVVAGCGCASVGPRQQRLVSKPDMVFSEPAFLSYQNQLLQQVEPGSAFSGGAQSGGCTSCK
jgi:hypothetical protein